jgi:hypothetical protein
VAIGRSLRSALASIVPTWLANVPGFRLLYSFCYVIALIADCLREIAWEGRISAFPGVGTPTALPWIAQSRGLLQGPNETTAAFAARCIAYRQTWRSAGANAALAQNVQAFLMGAGTLAAGALPIVRVVDRAGNWVTANADGTLTRATAAWSWDGISGWDDGSRPQPPATCAAYVSDLWVIVAPPSGATPVFAEYTGTADAAWLVNAGQGNAVQMGLGHQANRAYVAGILDLVATWRGAHTCCRGIIFAADTVTFSPTTPTADGTYGNFSKNVAGNQVPARLAAARYWQPQIG